MRGGSFLFGLMLGGLASGLFLYLDWTRSSSTLALPESTIILEFKTPGGKARSIRAGEVRDDVRLKLKKVENDVLEIYRQAAKDKMFISALEAAEGKPELAAISKSLVLREPNADEIRLFVKQNKIEGVGTEQLKKFLIERNAQIQRSDAISHLVSSVQMKGIFEKEER